MLCTCSFKHVTFRPGIDAYSLAGVSPKVPIAALTNLDRLFTRFKRHGPVRVTVLLSLRAPDDEAIGNTALSGT